MSNDPAARVEQEKLNSPAAVTLEGFDKRLLAYAAVAGASLMAGAPCAEAGVIYNRTTHNLNYPGASSILIDLNNDGTSDFWLGTDNWNSSRSQFRSFYGSSASSNPGAQFLRRYSTRPVTSGAFIPHSNFIGPADEPWGSWARLARAQGYYSSSNWYGNGFYGEFANAGEGYLGVRIPSGGLSSYNYGWIRLNITASAGTSDLPIGVAVRGWAFEQTPNTPIHAGDEGGGVPEPGSLGLLAGGILGLAAWRRRKAAKG